MMTREDKQLRQRVRYAVTKARKSGELVEPYACENCGLWRCSKPLYAHHPDYKKPLAVIWLCSPCHRMAHPKDALAAASPLRQWRANVKVTQLQAAQLFGVCLESYQGAETGAPLPARIRLVLTMFKPELIQDIARWKVLVHEDLRKRLDAKPTRRALRPAAA